MKKQLIILLFLFLYSNVIAQLSPGKLHQAHADLEGLENCSNCHQFKKKISAQNCLQCHKLLADRIKAGKGLHADPNYQECEKCHVEHHGRDYELVYWPDGKDNFKHEMSGYRLEGKHATIKCKNCHQEKNIIDKQKYLAAKIDLNRTMLGLTDECISCHRDEHRTQLDKNCLNCHAMEGWKPAVKFNHQITRYPLIGKHQLVTCENCHIQVIDNTYIDDISFIKYKGIEFARCTACHNDVHNNKFGVNCETCHSPIGWKNVDQQQFDHGKTNFSLLGKHRQVTCEECHLPGKPLKIPHYDKCQDCHTDYHKGQFTEMTHIGNCEKCHSEDGFTPASFTIQQHNTLKFKLEGSHIAVPCNSCHKKTHQDLPDETIQFRYTSTQCLACHTDPHGGELNKYIEQNGCEYCHSPSSWYRISFDHNLTKFPLAGKHGNIACGECHRTDNKNNNFTFLNISVDCQDCHKDVHFGQFKEKRKKNGQDYTDCNTCHSSIDWLADKFDHNTASYKLEGAHQNVTCEQCHKLITLNDNTFRLYKPMRSDCKFCHDTTMEEL